jgi:hypothetical protein
MHELIQTSTLQSWDAHEDPRMRLQKATGSVNANHEICCRSVIAFIGAVGEGRGVCLRRILTCYRYLQASAFISPYPTLACISSQCLLDIYPHIISCIAARSWPIWLGSERIGHRGAPKPLAVSAFARDGSGMLTKMRTNDYNCGIIHCIDAAPDHLIARV